VSIAEVCRLQELAVENLKLRKLVAQAAG